MKQGQCAVLCVILLALWATDAKAQDHETRIKQLEDLIVKFDGHLDRIKEEYDRKLAEKLNAFESVYSLAKVPVGTILPFYGDPINLPANWKLCDGKKVTDRESPFLNQDLPDLSERFLKGADLSDKDDFGSMGGVGIVYAHSHNIVPAASVLESSGRVGIGTTYVHIEEAGAFDNRPPYLSVYFIIRIK
jgi:hypothetical protein